MLEVNVALLEVQTDRLPAHARHVLDPSRHADARAPRRRTTVVRDDRDLAGTIVDLYSFKGTNGTPQDVVTTPSSVTV